MRVLQEKEITRTGGSNTIPVDVRIIAATNQDLEEKVHSKSFREDLYYRLNVVPVPLPPLRKRQANIPLLVDFFISRANEELDMEVEGCTERAMQLLTSYDWPGNVRQLENAIRRAVLLSADKALTPEDFPDLTGDTGSRESDTSLENLIAGKLHSSFAQMDINDLDDLYNMVLHQMERPLISIILEKTRGNQVRTAEILGINRNTLRKKIQTLEIDIKKN